MKNNQEFFMSLENIKEETYYFDENGNSVPKECASKVIIRVTDENGKLIKEVFGACTPTKKQEENKTL